METNLDALFKTNEDFETKGIKLDFGNGVFFNVKRFGGKNAPAVQKMMAKHYKPYARAIEVGAFPEEKAREIMMKIFIESSVIGWEGIKGKDGKDIEFDTENALALFKRLPDLYLQVQNYASDLENFKEDLGNS